MDNIHLTRHQGLLCHWNVCRCQMVYTFRSDNTVFFGICKQIYGHIFSSIFCFFLYAIACCITICSLSLIDVHRRSYFCFSAWCRITRFKSVLCNFVCCCCHGYHIFLQNQSSRNFGIVLLIHWCLKAVRFVNSVPEGYFHAKHELSIDMFFVFWIQVVIAQQACNSFTNCTWILW